MRRMTVRDQPEPGVAEAAGEPGEPGGLAGSAACAHAERRLRADAARNRAAIVALARDVFPEHGLEAPLGAIAAPPAVGIPPLYPPLPPPHNPVAAPPPA